MVRDRTRRPVGCWECEVTLACPVIVTLVTSSKIVGRLPLCSACYAAYCRPLVQPPPGLEMPVHLLLIVERATDDDQDIR